ncbi:hypothetical protein ACWT_0169 [Actinoplanes sp. SE50]|uniref:hypothetical protein n=1 Tax=unclassified Actinoplanes TaxID=2626549 RepID=UPI00023ED539|nr:MULTISPECIES: hypothetical protein [unclassified Actinoplanes]AEV81183.1 hypothetical protein ACPL_284 [Actinoplanes sp. SE50/110]ATO79584.1 hypothetical protein ACWT_0169 [Actinoplanes sp. SE50]SLL96986.1 uncharacterized protein ACSP50_0182 [Actinoplanes sp. SE50/110]
MSITSGGVPSSAHLAAELDTLDNNVYGFMHNTFDLESLAGSFAQLGWAARRSASDEYEITCSWCRLNLFNSGGMPKFAGVVEPTRVDDLADVFRSLDVDYEIELYDVEGELVRTLLP